MVEPRISIPLTRVRFPSSAPPDRDQRHHGTGAGEESPVVCRQVRRAAPGSLQPVPAAYDWPDSASSARPLENRASGSCIQ